ncbi:MAG: hypothetical protein FIB04_15035 [Gammaproteobacteria bacterium]|nr:hypothetical protein [Gammaproteobacteria bacterium]
MPRMELLMCLIAGLSGGLVGVLWDGMVSTPLLARQSRSHPPYRAAGAVALFGATLLLAAGGAALGFLFWLGWGLISLVNAPWYLTGLLFGLLTWAGIAVPLLGGLALRLQDFGRTAMVLALEWLVTCLAIGLFCALAWHRYA